MQIPDAPDRRHRPRRTTAAMLLAIGLGLGAGTGLHLLAPPAVARDVVAGADIVAELFLRLIRMVIAPLVFATLAGGIAGMRGAAGIGRAAGVAMGWFVAASLVSLGLGLVAANLLHPGVGVALGAAQGTGSGTGAGSGHVAGGAATGLDLRRFVTGLVPASVIDAMARNDIVQIVVFAVLFGLAASAMPEAAAARLATGLSDLAGAMLRLTGLVMRLAPFAAAASLVAAVGRAGPGLAASLGLMVGGFYAAMLVLWLLLGLAGLVLLGRPVLTLLRMIVAPLLLAFATGSSEAVFPLLVETLERFGVPPRLVGFVLPLGYAFNLDGSMLFQSFAALFIAQAAGVAMGPGQQLGMLLVLMATSKGTAGVPRAAVVALAGVLPLYGLPDSGLLLILGVDHLLDMGRTATNVVGNALATAVVARRVGVGAPGPGAEAAGAG